MADDLYYVVQKIRAWQNFQIEPFGRDFSTPREMGIGCLLVFDNPEDAYRSADENGATVQIARGIIDRS